MPDNTGVNKVFLLGTVLLEPRCIAMSDLNKEYVFSLVTKEMIARKDGYAEQLEYHHIRTTTMLMQQIGGIKKGQIVHIEGRIQTASWRSSDAIKRYRTEGYAIHLRRLTAASLAEIAV